MQLNDVIKGYMYEITLENYSKRTIRGYKNNLLRFAQYIKNEGDVTEIEVISNIHIKK
ncbi:hypothetical protein [Clostridium felsineum]|uniref:hypothetical protein n=1 Tax=Clostridium felsineum TaxID=36839 RepID=UPI0015910C73|nr:hypothetical protein [Clostridium felsineum]